MSRRSNTNKGRSPDSSSNSDKERSPDKGNGPGSTSNPAQVNIPGSASNPNHMPGLGSATGTPTMRRLWPMLIQSLPLLLAGIACIFSFAPFGLWPLQFVCLAVPVWLLLRTPEASIRQQAWRGWVFGMGWTVTGMYWLFYTMHHYGHLPAIVAALAVVLLGSLYLAVFSGAAFAATAWLRQRWQLGASSTGLLVFPACWALGEWMRGWLLTGVPWVVSGYAHSNSPLAGFAPLIGVYGIGLVVALVAACLALVASANVARKPAIGWLALILVASGLALRMVPWSSPLGQPISVRLLQGNVSQESKFDRDRIGFSLDLYRNMIEAAPADLIATPETALPLFIHQLPADYAPRLQHFANASDSHLALGLLIADGEQEYANSLVGISPGQSSLYRYNKGHLVPFGEFVPWGFHWFVNAIGIPMADQTAGKSWQAPWQVKDQWVLPNICYEDLFGEEIAHHMNTSRADGKPVASMLLNISNLAWFDDSLALPQHLQISQLRAIETARPMLRATNTGATAVINFDGAVLQVLPYLQPGELKANVQGRQGITPFVRFGNLGMLLLSGIALLLAWRQRDPQNPIL